MILLSWVENLLISFGAVPGMLSEFMDLPFINACTAFNFNGTNATWRKLKEEKSMLVLRSLYGSKKD